MPNKLDNRKKLESIRSGGLNRCVCASVLSVLCVLPSFGATNSQITKLIKEKQQKYAQLEECTKKVTGFKIAGISTLGLTAVGIGGNIALASKNKQLDKKINGEGGLRSQLTKEQEKLEKKNAEISAEKLKIAEKNCNKDTHVWDGKECNPKPKEPTDNNDIQPVTNATVIENAEQTAGQSIVKAPDNSSIKSDDKNNNTKKTPTVITSDNNSTNARITTKPQTEVRDGILLSPDDLQAKADADYKQYRKDQAKPNSPAAHIPALKNTMDVLSEANQDKSISMQLAVPAYGIPNNITVTQSQLEQVAKQAKENEIKQKELEEKKAKEEKEREKQAKKDERHQKKAQKNNQQQEVEKVDWTELDNTSHDHGITKEQFCSTQQLRGVKIDPTEGFVKEKINSGAGYGYWCKEMGGKWKVLSAPDEDSKVWSCDIDKSVCQNYYQQKIADKLPTFLSAPATNLKSSNTASTNKEKQAIAEIRQEIEKDNPDNFM